MLNALVAEISLQGPGIDAIVGKFEPAGVAQHVRVSLDFEACVSGNPGGRPKGDATVKELARAHTVEAIETLVRT